MRAGRPIVLVHGLIGFLHSDEIVDGLAPRKVLAPSLLGYGDEAGTDPAIITLQSQADYVIDSMRSAFGSEPVDLVGHSVGGAIAMLVAHKRPRQIANLVSVEGNFSLKDAFWSASVGRMTEAEAETMLAGFRADPEAWLKRAVPSPTPQQVGVAKALLAYQPASTLRAMGKAVVQTTEPRAYLEMVGKVLSEVPVHLMAGKRSASGWDVPAWARSQAASDMVIPDTGHMMMMEKPVEFTHAVLAALGARGS